MNPSLDQVESSLFAVQKHFENEMKSLQRYAEKPESKQSYIDERNQELAKLKSAVKTLEKYHELSQLLYKYCGTFRNSISADPHAKEVKITIKLKDGDSKGSIIQIV